jgi:menaquinone-dependent protoporphyrinogen oxidase
MRVLVAYATHYGATREIAERVAQVLLDNGVDATLSSVDDDPSVAGYDAFVVGSAIHAGHWLKPAGEFLAHHAAELDRRPVWLFSSGPIGDAVEKPQPLPKEVARFLESYSVRGHLVFGGAFDRNSTAEGGWLERTVGRFIPEGDFRSWPDIDGWSREIAAQLNSGGSDRKETHDGALISG